MEYSDLKLKHAKLNISAKEEVVMKYLYYDVIGYQINNVNDVVRLAGLNYGLVATNKKKKILDKDI